MNFNWDEVVALLKQQANNQFLTGGFLLGFVGCLIAIVKHWPFECYKWVKRQFFIDFEIDANEEAFNWFNDWLAKQSYTHRRARKLLVKTVHYGQKTNDDRPRVVVSPAKGTHWLWWKGYFLSVSRGDGGPKTSGASVGGDGHSNRWTPEKFTVSVLTRRRDVILKLLHEARDVRYPPEEQRVSVHHPRYDGWNCYQQLKNRKADSVVLAEGVMENLLADVQRFIAGEEWYFQRGVPYRRGYLLHGKPGNGKSSAVMGIASTLGLDIYVLNLSSGVSDDGLQKLVAEIPEHAILLIEDIDCVFSERKAGDTSSKLSFSGLLNAIDGVCASEGRLLFMTTNHIERLDAALIRQGRCDLKLEIGDATPDQARRMFLRFFPDRVPESELFAEVARHDCYSMAAVQGHLLKYSDDPHLAIARFNPKSLDQLAA